MTADTELMAQVLLNLPKNGAESARSRTNVPRIAVTVTGMGEAHAKITVSDNGPGIAYAIASDIFLPIFTTKRAGTEVGLSFARQIVLLHTGSIEAKTGPEGGAAFELII